MPKDKSFHDYVVYDVLSEISGITSRAMFGGWAIYKGSAGQSPTVFVDPAKRGHPRAEARGIQPLLRRRSAQMSSTKVGTFGSLTNRDRNGIVFGIITEGELYFKAEKGGESYFQDIGSHPFTYKRKDKKTITMSYWLVPEDIMSDKEKINGLVKQSFEANRPNKNKESSLKRAT